MHPTVTIKSIKNRYLLTDKEYDLILKNIGKPFQLASVWFNKEDQLVHFTVRSSDGVITLFDDNVIEGEFGNGIKFQLG